MLTLETAPLPSGASIGPWQRRLARTHAPPAVLPLSCWAMRASSSATRERSLETSSSSAEEGKDRILGCTAVFRCEYGNYGWWWLTMVDANDA